MTTAILAPEIAAELPPEPYPGLRPFEPAEWAIFFGREPMTDEVIARLAAQHLVVVHGASGCGKSSLVRAGVLPWLQLDYARSGKPWKTAVARPSGGPLRNIARALAQELGPLPGPSSSADAASTWHDRLALGSPVLDDIGEALRAQDSASLCLLIDQFEELFRYAREQSREEAQLLVEILEAVADPEVVPRGLFLILTMRSDYMGDCARFAGFAEVVNRCQYLLPRMDEFALLRAVHEPAALFGGQIDSAVGDRLLFAAREEEEDALPVLQHALMRSCAHARERCGKAQSWTVTLADLQAVEGEHGSLSEHAEEVLSEAAAGDPARLKAAEWLFRSLTDLDAEGRIIRRPCRLADLIVISGGDRVAVTAVLEAFRAPGRSFFTPYLPDPLGDDTEIDISHEALIHRWRRLSDPTRDPETKEPAGWLWREFEDGQRWRALAVQARTFCDDPSATLSPATTEAYERWWPEHTPAWTARYARKKDQAFEEYREVDELWRASKQALQQERARRERERRLRRTARLSVGAATALLALVAGSVWQWSEGQAQRAQAQRYAEQAIDITTEFVMKAVQLSDEFGAPSSVIEVLLTQAGTGFEQLMREGTRAPRLRSGRAKLLMAWADHYRIIGNTERQWDAVKQARDILKELVRDDPSNPEWLRQLAISHDLVGDALANRLQLDAALAEYRVAQSIREKLSTDDPKNPNLQRDLSISDIKIGDILFRQGHLDEALEAFQSALVISESLARADPMNIERQRDVLVINHRIGDVLAKQGDLNRAEEAYRTSLVIAERLAAGDPSNMQLQRDLAASHERIGSVLEDQGDMEKALAAYRTSLSITERLAAADPSNVFIQRALSLDHENVGRILLKEGDLQVALDHYRRSLAIVDRLAAADPSNTKLQRDVLEGLDRIGELLDKQGQVQEAIAAYQASHVIADRLAAAEPRNADWQYLSYRQLGRLREREGNREEARDMYCRAKNVVMTNSALRPGEPQWQKRLDWLEKRLDALQSASRC